MKKLLIFSLTMLLLTACGKSEESLTDKFSNIKNTQLLERIETSVPNGVEISKASVIDLGVLISGKAESTKTVKMFLNSILANKIDTASLRSIKKAADKQQFFEIEVITYPKK